MNEQEVFTPPALKIVWQFSAMVSRGGTHDSSLSTRDYKKEKKKKDPPTAQRQMDGSGNKTKECARGRIMQCNNATMKKDDTERRCMYNGMRKKKK